MEVGLTIPLAIRRRRNYVSEVFITFLLPFAMRYCTGGFLRHKFHCGARAPAPCLFCVGGLGLQAYQCIMCGDSESIHFGSVT